MITNDLAIYTSKQIIKESLPLFREFKDIIKHHLNDGLLDYYYLMICKYKLTKTLLYHQPVSFYDIYFDTNLILDDKTYSTFSVSELFYEHKRIIISGAAGSGKSTLVKHLFLNSLFESYKIPILITLRDLNNVSINISEYIKTNVLNNKLSPNDKILVKLFQEGKFIFFLDGYDEINSEFKEKIIRGIEDFIDMYPENSYLITSRPYSNIEYFKDFYNYSIANLNSNQIEEFIKFQIKDSLQSRKIIESLQDNESMNYINSFLTNPMLLTLYILTYNSNSQIPNKKYIFYRRVFDVLFKEHDSATKTGYQREIKSKLNQEEFEIIIKCFAFISLFENKFNFDKLYITEKLNIIKERYKIEYNNNDFIDDLKISISFWVEDSGMYSFAHKSLQEYFAAVYITTTKENTQKKIYQKINDLSYFIHNKKSKNLDLTNLLALCKEMDEKNYLEFHKLNVLLLLKDIVAEESTSFQWRYPFYIFITNSSTVSTDYYMFFYSRLFDLEVLPQSKDISMIVFNNEEIFNELFVSFDEKDLSLYIGEWEIYKETPFFKNINPRRFINKNELNEKRLLILNSSGIIDCFNETKEHIDKYILEVKSKINEIKKNEDSLVEMI